MKEAIWVRLSQKSTWVGVVTFATTFGIAEDVSNVWVTAITGLIGLALIVWNPKK